MEVMKMTQEKVIREGKIQGEYTIGKSVKNMMRNIEGG